MLVKLIYLFTVAIIVVQGTVGPEITDSDASEWTELHRQYLSHSPNEPFAGQMTTNCRIMRTCCPSLRSQFFNLMRLHTFEETCYGKKASTPSRSFSTECNKSIQKLTAIKKTNDYALFMKAHTNIPGSDERFRKWRKQMLEVCPADELEAQYCEPNDMNKFESCQRKVLNMIAETSTEEEYFAYVAQLKKYYRIYLERLSKAFPNLTM